jgi:hypothetical protein
VRGLGGPALVIIEDCQVWSVLSISTLGYNLNAPILPAGTRSYLLTTSCLPAVPALWKNTTGREEEAKAVVLGGVWEE